MNIIGRLGADVDLRYTTTSQKAVARISVAVNDRYGENERVYWFSVICWNGLAETVSAYLHKGSRVAVTGRLSIDTLVAMGNHVDGLIWVSAGG